MVTLPELLRVLLAPLIVSAIIAVIARRVRWAWLTPVGVGAAFLTGYGLVGVPRFPPSDGSDWLFWITIPLLLAGVGATFVRPPAVAVFGLITGAVVVALLWPLVPAAIDRIAVLDYGVVFAIAGTALLFSLQYAETKLGPTAVLIALWVTLSATAVIVMSSNFRVLGLYGIAAAASVFGVIAGPPASVRGVTVVAISLLAGLLTCGHFYPDPGVTWTNAIVLWASPLLLVIAATLPIKRPLVRAVIGLIAVAIAVASVTVPTAIAAKHAAEDDPYGSTG